MLLAKTGASVAPPSLTADEVVGAAAVAFLSLSIFGWMLLILSYRHRGAKPVLIALVTGAVLGMLFGSIYSFFPGTPTRWTLACLSSR
jgi:hypothetical protein